MIYDGYTRRIRIGSHRFSYRPSLEDERRRFRWELSFFDDDTAQDLMDTFIIWHIVQGSTDISNLTEPEYKQLWLAVQGLVVDESGERWCEVERASHRNLADGVRLHILHPRLATRTCKSCQTWWYSLKTGLVILDGEGKPTPRIDVTPCRTQIGCPKGTPETELRLSKANNWAYNHFLDCDAVGVFPDDPIVKRNARIIRKVIAECQKKVKSA